MARRQSVSGSGGIGCGVGGRPLPPPPPGLGSAASCPFGPRGPSPMSLKQQQPPIITPAGGAGFLPHEVRPPLHYASSLQRRSVPEINPPIYPQIKRNSYQGDHRMVSTSSSSGSCERRCLKVMQRTTRETIVEKYGNGIFRAVLLLFIDHS